ncbi:protein kinase [Solirubrobacter ginsenosidimutans]|uniref:non-specific serine/threonine protein kinase n=1 Tax=Solirubrobacter ginsenosidimutans TaxID=490573 RepID=A0A9X3S4B0_9ACTN|nr:serine/threonine-protein kinase [Solirubrobacter ginsenosidimutans]MDA0164267.1 protein kinase [Solirubrobacter ginsenosidimutans]
MGLLAPGAVVAGYRIESVLGRGGMGVVYRAADLELERIVALKVIAPELLDDLAVRARFLKEVRAAASIEHPNVIPVYAAGERGGVAYLAMRLIDGDDLKELVRNDGPLPAGRATDLIARAAAGLDAIHRAGYVHRDVKPSNVLVDRDGHVYVTDFGLAKQVLSTDGATGTGRWVGTLDYIAPEQVRGGAVDARADVYALGGVLAFVLTGHVPFERDADEAKLWAQLSDPPPVPSQLRPELPRALDAVVARAMAKRAEDRYPSAGDLGRAAHAAATGAAPQRPERMVARGAAAPGGQPSTVVLDPEASTVSAGAAPPRGRRRRRVAAALGALALAGVVAAVVLFPSDGNPPRAAAAHVAETIRNVGDRPNGIAVAGGDLWVTSNHQPRLDRIDIATRRERADHPEVGLGASDIVSRGNTVWVAARGARQVAQIDAASGQVTRRLHPGGAPWRLAVGFGSVWVGTLGATPAENALVRYSETGSELHRWTRRRGVAAIATGAGAVWLVERTAPNVVRFDPRTGKSVPWGTLAAPSSALYFDGRYLWATLNTDDLIVRIDSRHPRVLVPTATGRRPQQIVAAGGRLFVASYADHTVRVLDPRTSRSIGAPLDVAENPFALVADGQSVWVTGAGDNTVTRIALR